MTGLLEFLRQQCVFLKELKSTKGLSCTHRELCSVSERKPSIWTGCKEHGDFPLCAGTITESSWQPQEDPTSSSAVLPHVARQTSVDEGFWYAPLILIRPCRQTDLMTLPKPCNGGNYVNLYVIYNRQHLNNKAVVEINSGLLPQQASAIRAVHFLRIALWSGCRCSGAASDAKTPKSDRNIHFCWICSSLLLSRHISLLCLHLPHLWVSRAYMSPSQPAGGRKEDVSDVYSRRGR